MQAGDRSDSRLHKTEVQSRWDVQIISSQKQTISKQTVFEKKPQKKQKVQISRGPAEHPFEASKSIRHRKALALAF